MKCGANYASLPRIMARPTGATRKGPGNLPNYVKGLLVGLLVGVGIAVTLRGADNDNPTIVGLGIAFIAAVLGSSFTPPRTWLKWLLEALLKGLK